MDKEQETIQKKIDELVDKIADAEIGSKEFKELTESYRNLMDALLKDKTYIENKSSKNQELDLKEKEIDARVKEVEARERMSKHSDVWGVIGGILKAVFTAAGTAGCILLVGREKNKDDVFIDKDELRLATGIAPR